MSFLARFSLANRGLVALIAVVVTAFGLLAVPSLKQQLLPSLDYPAAFVAAAYPGASPEIVEEQVTAPIEDAVQGIDGLESVTSTSREGSATVQVQFDFGTNLDNAVNKLQSQLNSVGPRLPAGVEPVVFAGRTDDVPAIVLAASSTGDERAFADKLAATVVPHLREIPGVREVTVTGARDRTVVITPDPAKLARARVTAGNIVAVLRANGVALPAGALTEGGQTLTVQVGSRITSVADLENLYLTPTGNAAPAPVRLGDVATVEQRLAEPTTLTRTDGVPSLGISVTAAPDGNAVQISHDIRDRLGELAAALGGDAKLTVIFDQAPFVEKSINGLTTEGLLGLAMAVLVILVFLLSVRSTIVTAVSIPLSVLVALIVLRVDNLSLNLLTLGGLTIAVGRVVDDSIVVLENIKRHLGYGEDKHRAIIDGVREVAGAVTASTLTTVAVFAPIALVSGFVGQLFTPFAVTVTVALLASLLVSLTVIPVLAYWFLRPASGADPESVRSAAHERELRSPLQRAYLPIIRFATRRRLATVLAGVLVLIGTFWLGNGLKTNFIDQSGETTLSINQQLPPGTSLERTDEAARKVEAVLADTPDVATYQVTVGGAGGFFGRTVSGAPNQAHFSAMLKDGTDTLAAQDRLRTRLAGLGDDAGTITVGVGGGGGGGFSANRLRVIVQGTDPAAMRTAADQVRSAMADIPEVTDVTSDLARSAPRIQITVDRAKAARAGLSEATIGQIVGQTLRGTPVGRVVIDGHQQDLVLGTAAPPSSLDQLRALPLGVGVTLGSVAEVARVDGPAQITRIDGARSVTVSGTATGSNIGATTGELNDRLSALSLPAGTSYTVAGVSADQSNAFGDLGLALLAAVAIVFLIMAATFRSLVQPLILLVSVPFAATGAVGLLLATDTALGVPALIGMLMLVGIVVTNAIVLMDLINQYRSQGMDVQEAVIEGGRRRLRPILMTAIATICALTPMALGLTGEGGFISRPLAIVVIGGLISSTLLTLVLVPTLYTMVEGARQRLGRWHRRHRGGAGPDPGADSSGDTGTDPTEPATPSPVSAIYSWTDQFEILRMPGGRGSRPS